MTLGGAHGCAILRDETVRCWGENQHGEVGDGTQVDRLVPTTVIGLTRVRQLALGFRHSCALRSDGGVRCWGDNASGQLGDGTVQLRLHPQPALVSYGL